MKLVLMRNKSLQTIDLSQCSFNVSNNFDNIELVFQQFDNFCNIRTLITDNLNTDMNYIMDTFGIALGLNTKMEGLSMKENRIKQQCYCSFWELIQENKTLRKLDASKTDITDKVCVSMCNYIR
jgi:hypothetical protein